MLSGRFLMAARNVQGGRECREALQREEIKIPTVGRNAPAPLSLRFEIRSIEGCQNIIM